MSDNHGIFSDIRIVDGVLTIVETERSDLKEGEVVIVVTEDDIIEEIILPE